MELALTAVMGWVDVFFIANGPLPKRAREEAGKVEMEQNLLDLPRVTHKRVKHKLVWCHKLYGWTPNFFFGAVAIKTPTTFFIFQSLRLFCCVGQTVAFNGPTSMSEYQVAWALVPQKNNGVLSIYATLLVCESEKES